MRRSRILRIVDVDTGQPVAFTETPPTPVKPEPKPKRSKMERPAKPPVDQIRAQRRMGMVVRRTMQRGGGLEGLLTGTARMLLMELARRMR